ncbi:dUTP diphosphatase [Agrilactobacillus fermenti]|uniref:dUTP diphosphatase n=1 Tax=Agrilactobacillus fermenti TaxID=2586909 RepID=UPI001E4C72E6|nr:dUTP diphosphatase [Agrilactobacillus fermenti]MCD2255417.1 dUTP diphosphatase [Agrilactobacillus fermenti]
MICCYKKLIGGTRLKTRGFEIVTKYQDQALHLPVRQTRNAAGYDFEAAADFDLPSIWQLNFIKILHLLRHQTEQPTVEQVETAQQVLKPFLIPTGIKAYMQPDEVLILVNRSSGPLKRRLILPNGLGVIDADYYNNPDNEGEIFVQLINYGVKTVHIKKGDRLAQGIFIPYLKSDQDQNDGAQRTGGFGSSGK